MDKDVFVWMLLLWPDISHVMDVRRVDSQLLFGCKGVWIISYCLDVRRVDSQLWI